MSTNEIYESEELANPISNSNNSSVQCSYDLSIDCALDVGV